MEEFYCLSCGNVTENGTTCPACDGSQLMRVPDDEYEDWLDDICVRNYPDDFEEFYRTHHSEE